MDRSFLDTMSISGYKSFGVQDDLNSLSLKRVNVLIGENGTGKSCFASFFNMLGYMMNGRLQRFVGENGGANEILHFGSKKHCDVCNDIVIIPITIRTGHSKETGGDCKGGVISFLKVKKEIDRILSVYKYSSDYVTTMFDLFRIPSDFPHWKEAMEKNSAYGQKNVRLVFPIETAE